MIINDTDAIAMLYAYIVFVIFIFFGLKFLKKKELILLLVCGSIQAFLSIFIEPIGWISGLWEFAIDRTSFLEVILEGFYAAAVFYTNWMIIGTIFIYLKRYNVFFPWYLLIGIMYVVSGTFMDVCVEPFYTRPIIVVILWCIGYSSYILTFLYLYEIMFMKL